MIRGATGSPKWARLESRKTVLAARRPLTRSNGRIRRKQCHRRQNFADALNVFHGKAIDGAQFSAGCDARKTPIGGKKPARTGHFSPCLTHQLTGIFLTPGDWGKITPTRGRNLVQPCSGALNGAFRVTFARPRSPPGWGSVFLWSAHGQAATKQNQTYNSGG